MMPAYDYWQASLDGNVPPELMPKIDEPQFGFWRHAYGDPVALYPAGDSIAGVRGFQGKERRLSQEQIIDLWPWISAWAVSEDDWRNAFHGEGWPDQAIGHNQGPAMVPETRRKGGRPATGKPTPANPRARAIFVTDTLRAWLAEHEKIATRPEADQGAQLLNELRTAVNSYEEEIGKEKKVFQTFLDQLRDRFREVETPADELLDMLKPRLADYMEAAGVTQVGALGARASYSPREFCVVDDWQAATLHFVGNIKLKEVVERLAKAELKAGNPVPGARLTKVGAAR